jgi:tRNA G18 (ribose-2'-O)-methylase SpoU
MSNAKRKRFDRTQALRRYEKHRCRNLLARPGPSPFVLVLDHLKAGFNVPKIFRSAEAFGAAQIHLVGIGPFDPAPAKGAFKKVPARFFDDFPESYGALRQEGYSLFCLAPEGGETLTDSRLPLRSAFVLGHEETGLSFSLSDFPDVRPLTIPQLGVVQSLNVSVAASIVMYEYVRQHTFSHARVSEKPR